MGRNLKYKTKYSKILTKKFLVQKYIKNKKSTVQIAKEVKSGIMTIYEYLKKYNIKIRNHSEASKISKHKANCQCGICKAKRGENKGRNNPMFGKLKSGQEAIHYIDGRTIKKYYCIECEKKISRNSGFYGQGRCNKCKGLLERANTWNNGSSFEPYPLGWTKTFKEQIRYKDSYKCQICGCPEVECNRKLSVHHIDYNKQNLSPKNLISLCQSCHMKTNFNRYYWINFWNERR